MRLRSGNERSPDGTWGDDGTSAKEAGVRKMVRLWDAATKIRAPRFMRRVCLFSGKVASKQEKRPVLRDFLHGREGFSAESLLLESLIRPQERPFIRIETFLDQALDFSSRDQNRLSGCLHAASLASWRNTPNTLWVWR